MSALKSVLDNFKENVILWDMEDQIQLIFHNLKGP